MQLALIDTADAQTPAPEFLERLVHQAEKANASDIHLQMLGKSADISFRLDGAMTDAAHIPADLAERVFGRIKFLARLKTYQETLPQDGRIEKAELNARSDIRVATYPTVTGEKIVLRLFNTPEIRSLKQLEFPDSVLTQLESFLHQTAGVLLLTGPAGSGKTTTIYACLSHLAQFGGRHIITVEDPAEQIVPGVMQTEVNEARGLDFAKAARHLLRQDPQVLVIGEIRDEETANVCIRAGLTGHLVISTLHAGSCKGVFERLLVLSNDRSALASSVELVLNQRLVRRICAACHGAGCTDCLSTGYLGRVPVVEQLRVDQNVRQLLLSNSIEQLVARPSMEEHARTLLQQRITSSVELQRVLGLNLQA